MKEYIEREAVLDAIKSVLFDQQCDCEVMPYVFKRVQGVEAADVAPVRHAHWFDVGSLSCRCSGCGCKNDRETAYCPHCGALMDGEETPTCHDGVCDILGVDRGDGHD